MGVILKCCEPSHNWGNNFCRWRGWWIVSASHISWFDEDLEMYVLPLVHASPDRLLLDGLSLFIYFFVYICTIMTESNISPLIWLITMKFTEDVCILVRMNFIWLHGKDYSQRHCNRAAGICRGPRAGRGGPPETADMTTWWNPFRHCNNTLGMSLMGPLTCRLASRRGVSDYRYTLHQQCHCEVVTMLMLALRLKLS